MTAITSAMLTIPMSNTGQNGNGNVNKIMPGWNDNVKPFDEETLYWHSLWKSNGSPDNGMLFRRRKAAHISYHSAVNLQNRTLINLELRSWQMPLLKQTRVIFAVKYKRLNGVKIAVLLLVL